MNNNKIPHYRKQVLFPISVPNNKYCYSFHKPYTICSNFDNVGGCPSCHLNFGGWELKSDYNGVLKPEECLNLKENKNERK